MYANNQHNAPKFDFPYQEQRQDQGAQSYTSDDKEKQLAPNDVAEIEKALRKTSTNG